MVEETKKPIIVDLNQFKLHIHLEPENELTLHFDSPSRRFYLSVISLVIHQMKTAGRITSINMAKHLEVLALLNETIGGAAGSSVKEHLLPRIYRKWKDALPDLENAPLFKVVGRKKRYADATDPIYTFGERVKDNWANLFDYKGSHENVRLRFSIDRLGLGLDDVAIVYGSGIESDNTDPWERFIGHLAKSRREGQKSKTEGLIDEKAVPAKERIPRWRRAMGQDRQWALVGAIFILVISISIPVLRNAWRQPFNFERASLERMAYPLPDKPSIAVLPFQNLSDDPEEAYFCDGLTQDVITGLSKIAAFFVISPDSTFTYRGRKTNRRHVSEELGVRYVLEGSVRRQAERIRISIQLFDMIGGRTLWAERYDRQLRDIFAIQDQITISILSALRYKLTNAERSSILHKSTQNLQAYLKVLEGAGYMYLFENAEGLKCFEEAITYDPRFAEAYAWKSFAHMRTCLFGPRSNRVDHFINAIESAKKCKELDDKLAACNMVMGFTHLVNFDYINALQEESLAVSRWPNSSQAAVFLAIALRAAGQYDEALKEIDRALRLNPVKPAYALQILGLVYFETGRYDEAITACKKVLETSPHQLPAYMVLALIYRQLGRDDDARSAAEAILRIRPDFIARDYTMLFPKKTVKDIEAMLNGLLSQVKHNN